MDKKKPKIEVIEEKTKIHVRLRAASSLRELQTRTWVVLVPMEANYNVKSPAEE